MTVRRACKSPRIGLPASTSAAPATAAKQAYRLIPPEVATIDDGAVPEIGDKEGARVRGQQTSRRIRAGPRMGPVRTGCAYSQMRKSRGVGPISDRNRRPTTRSASQEARSARRGPPSGRRCAFPSAQHQLARCRAAWEDSRWLLPHRSKGGDASKLCGATGLHNPPIPMQFLR